MANQAELCDALMTINKDHCERLKDMKTKKNPIKSNLGIKMAKYFIITQKILKHILNFSAASQYLSLSLLLKEGQPPSSLLCKAAGGISVLLKDA